MPHDIVSAKLIVQLGDVAVEHVRAYLRVVDDDPSGELDLVSRLAQANFLAQAQIKRARLYVALFEHVRHEAVYLRQLERARFVPRDEVGELIARIELCSYRRRLGAVLVELGRITVDQAVEIERQTRKILAEEDAGILQRYRRRDFEGVVRPLIPASAKIGRAAFRISVLFRSRETQVRVTKALLKLRLEDDAPPATAGARAVGTQALQVFDTDETADIQVIPGSARFRVKSETPRSLSASVEEELQPQTIADFTVVECLGRGGMGAVYLGREEGTGMMVAIKVMHDRLADPVDLARFNREAHITALLGHPNCVHLIERGTTARGLSYLVIPFYAGKSLRALLRDTGRLEASLAFHIFEQLLAGTQALHDVRVVHRDLKPENVFLLAGTPPQVRIVDLGIARVLDDRLPEADRQFRTMDGVISGSPAYIAPETVTGDPIGPQTDIYSLGVMFFQMLTGRLPLSAGTAYEFLREHLVGVPLSLAQAKPGIHWCDEFEQLMAAMLAKEPKDRPATCAAILAVLQRGLRARTLEGMRAQAPAPAQGAPKPGIFNDFFKMLSRSGDAEA